MAAPTLVRPAAAPARRRWSGHALFLVVFALCALAFAAPLLLMLSSAFKTPEEVFRIPPTIIPENPTLDGFRTVLNEAPFLTWMRNSVVVAGLGTALTLATSTLAGYIYAKFDFPGRRPTFGLLLISLMVPFPVLLIPTYLVAGQLRLLNTVLALVMPFTVSAFGVFMMRQFAQGVPDDLLDAARVDGAGELRIFLTVVLPLLRAPAAALGIFTFLAAWNDYLWPLVAVDDPGLNTLPLALSYFNGAHTQRLDLMMAATAMSIIPVYLVFVIFQRRIVASLAMTGMK